MRNTLLRSWPRLLWRRGRLWRTCGARVRPPRCWWWVWRIGMPRWRIPRWVLRGRAGEVRVSMVGGVIPATTVRTLGIMRRGCTMTRSRSRPSMIRGRLWRIPRLRLRRRGSRRVPIRIGMRLRRHTIRTVCTVAIICVTIRSISLRSCHEGEE